MPIYEYQCQKCGTHIEKRQSISEEPLTECEKCGGKLEKQISLSGFQFKGAGWYVTDYAGKKSPSADKSDTGEKPLTSEKTEKISTTESTAKTDGASNSKNDAPRRVKSRWFRKKGINVYFDREISKFELMRFNIGRKCLFTIAP